MRNTTLCYIERGQQYLMLHRVKKENDLNHDKWVGIGGKFEGNETPDECLLREAYEETGLTLTDWRCRGVVTFLSDTWEGEYMYLFTAGGFTGTLRVPELDAVCCQQGRDRHDDAGRCRGACRVRHPRQLLLPRLYRYADGHGSAAHPFPDLHRAEAHDPENGAARRAGEHRVLPRF